MLHRRNSAAGLAALCAIAGITTLSAPASFASASSPEQLGTTSTLTWGACEDGVDAAFECATLTVPLDYGNPTGDTLDLAVIRLPAAGATREGAILFNPGGPGGSGYDFVANAASIAQQQMGFGSFDLVGFDPRGVDRSNGLRCLNDEQVGALLYADDNPSTAEGQLVYGVANAMFGIGCRLEYGDTLMHYSTANTARDMDAIRAALGDEQISYIGISYGTYLGGVYATLFPERVRAMVLDAAMDPNDESEIDQYITQLVGFEDAFKNWAAWCEEGSECEFTDVDVAGRWDRLLAQVDATPIFGSDGREVNQVVMETATISTLYAEIQWPLLGAALADAEQGDGDGLLALADSYVGRSNDGSFSTIQQSLNIISCASGLENQQPVDPQALLDQILTAAPRFSRGFDLDSFHDSCRDLFDETAELIEPAYSGTAPIVVVGGQNDPATPFRWAEELTTRMGPSARLVTFTGEGHGQILVNSCVTQIEAAVIAQLQLPAPGTVCEPDPPMTRPAFWDQLTVPAGVGPEVNSPVIATSLGLTESQSYWQAYAMSGDTNAVAAAYGDVLRGAGLFAMAPDTTTFPGTTTVIAAAMDGTTVLTMVVPPETLADPTHDFAGLADAVPEGQGIVIVAAIQF